jgi:hypothetical protein
MQQLVGARTLALDFGEVLSLAIVEALALERSADPCPQEDRVNGLGR